MWTWRRQGGGMNWEAGIDICAQLCVEQIASGKLPCNTGNSAQCCDDLGGGTLVTIQSLSHVRLFAIPWMAAYQASLSFNISPSILKLMSLSL